MSSPISPSPSQAQAYLFLGPPASGKGTHCRVIGMLPGFCHLSTGQAFRRLVERGGAGADLLQRIQSTTAKGDLLPDEIAQHAAQDYLEELITAGKYRPEADVLLFDGLPRTRAQAAWLDERYQILGVFEFVCSEEVSLERAQQRSRKEGRSDDSDLAIVRHRCRIYQNELPGLLGFFPDSLVNQIDTTEPPHHVLRRVLEHMN